MLSTLLLCAALGQNLGQQEQVWIPAFNSYCLGQKLLSGPKAGEYIVNQVITSNQIQFQPENNFLNWLNSTRASYGLRAVGYDANLSNWAAMNNSQQLARGMGHFVLGPARRQNAAIGGWPGGMWMASPAHRAALLDPTISWIGIATAGAYWTFNAN